MMGWPGPANGRKTCLIHRFRKVFSGMISEVCVFLALLLSVSEKNKSSKENPGNQYFLYLALSS